MHVSIKWCVPWNYLPRAASLAASLKQEFGVDAELLRGSAGIFDVHADGKLIFSKHEHGRFPNDGEVEALLRAAGY